MRYHDFKNSSLRICAIFLIFALLSLSACSPGVPVESSEQNTGTTIIAPTSPNTTSTEPGSEDYFEFIFDPYVLSWEYADLYGEAFVNTYRAFADACMNFKPTFSCPDEDMFALLYAAQRTYMPWFDAGAYLTFDSFDASSNTVVINYRHQNAQDHLASISAFVDKVTGIIENCLHKGDNELERVFALYQEYSGMVMYDADLMPEKDSPYFAIMNNRGTGQSIAGAYVFLLLQAGIKANVCGGLTYDRTVAHEWCIVSIDGEYYYMDPTFENGDTGGLGLSYFGMSTQKRADAGGFDPEIFRIGLTGMLWGKDFSVDSERFSEFEGCHYFELDRDQNRVIYWTEGNAEQYFGY